jgi:DNA-binding HxlR family transcriptional regulator
MAPKTPHVAHATLELLVEDWCLPVLRALMVGPRRPSELDARLPGLSHAALMRRLGHLHERGLAQRERSGGLNRQTRYELTTPGRRILDVAVAAERWERLWTDEQADGHAGLALIADEHTREILLALAAEPLSPSLLEQRVPLSRSPLRKRLADLTRSGILARHADGDKVRYELTDSARDLALIAAAAARWAWEWEPPEQPPNAHDVASTLHLFAPLAQLPADLGGICRMHIGDGPVVHLVANGRRITALAAAPDEQPDAVCHATAHEWCDALLLRRWGDFVPTRGDRALMATMIACVSTALMC